MAAAFTVPSSASHSSAAAGPVAGLVPWQSTIAISTVTSYSTDGHFVHLQHSLAAMTAFAFASLQLCRRLQRRRASVRPLGTLSARRCGVSNPETSRFQLADEWEEVEVEPLLRRLLLGTSKFGGDARTVPTLLQVGACDGDFSGESFSDDPVQNFLLAESQMRAVLVEPNPEVFGMLEKNVLSHFGEDGRVLPVNVAVSVSPEAASAGKVPFYVVSPRLATDHPQRAPHWARYQLSSMDREHVIGHHAFIGLSREEFSAYVDEIAVPCRTPADLLQEAALAPEAVNILVVDTEGFDAQIVQAFMQVPGFSPRVLIFEAAHLESSELRRLLTFLADQGYQIAAVRSKLRPGEPGDMVAWRLSEDERA